MPHCGCVGTANGTCIRLLYDCSASTQASYAKPMLPRAAKWILSLLLVGCARISGVDDYSAAGVPDRPGRQEVVRFLGGDACEMCIERDCAPEVDACASERDCADTAACMGRCSDPACVYMKCRGAEIPAAESGLGLLTACATNSCMEPCEIGTSWSCAGKYDWPAPPSEPFDVSFSIDIWNDSWDPSPHLIGARVGLCNDSALRSPNVPTVCPASDWLAPESTTDDEGRVTLHVTPVPGVRGPTVPQSHFYVGATPATSTQQYPTLDWRAEWNQPLRPVVGRGQMLLLPQGAPAVRRRFLCGFVLDCHGLRALSAQGLTASLENYSGAFYLMSYWDTDQGYHLDHTYLGGSFCAGISEDENPTPEAAGLYFLNIDDPTTLERRIRSPVTVPGDGSAGVVLFPPTSADVRNQ
jgi:hypothetical protein